MDNTNFNNGACPHFSRTMRTDIAPSELVVSIALRHSLPEYLFATQIPSDIALFILENADERLPDFSLAA
jgi:hypothetical protein